MNKTMLDDGLDGYVPRLGAGLGSQLIRVGTEQEANEAAVGNAPCIIRPGVDGLWRTWQLRRPLSGSNTETDDRQSCALPPPESCACLHRSETD
jgi:hypothetical protein